MKSREIKKFRKDYTKYEKRCLFEGYKLAVPFDEKEDVKRYGARWNADDAHWWMPEDRLLNQIHDNGTLVRDWLNDNEMIIGQYGEFQFNEQNENGLSSFDPHRGYKLVQGDVEITIQWYKEFDAVKFTEFPNVRGAMATDYLTIEDARTRWDELVAQGYNRVENS